MSPRHGVLPCGIGLLPCAAGFQLVQGTKEYLGNSVGGYCREAVVCSECVCPCSANKDHGFRILLSCHRCVTVAASQSQENSCRGRMNARSASMHARRGLSVCVSVKKPPRIVMLIVITIISIITHFQSQDEVCF